MNHEMIITITKGQQITLPASIRQKLGLEIGAKLEMTVLDGRIVLEPIAEDLEVLFAKAKKVVPKFNPTAEEMDEISEAMFR